VRAARWSSLAVALGLAACGSPSKDGGRGSLGRATGAAVLAALDAATGAKRPWRCARVDEVVFPSLAVETRAAPRLAFVAEARGAGEATAPVLEAVRKALDAAPVDVVIALGGMGETEDEIARALTPLARGAPWLTVAIPGDRESIPGHRAAIEALAAGGSRIVDGSQVRILDLGAALVATLPGAPSAGRLAAGAEGCVHADNDVVETLIEVSALATPKKKGARARPVLLATQRAPRGATDLAPGGVHAGDVGLARLLADRPVGLVVHGALDDASSRAGTAKPAPGLGVAVGALDATPRYRTGGARVAPSFLLVTVGADLAWKPVAPTVVP
jgi:hypothetical protein